MAERRCGSLHYKTKKTKNKNPQTQKGTPAMTKTTSSTQVTEKLSWKASCKSGKQWNFLPTTIQGASFTYPPRLVPEPHTVDTCKKYRNGVKLYCNDTVMPRVKLFGRRPGSFVVSLFWSVVDFHRKAGQSNSKQVHFRCKKSIRKLTFSTRWQIHLNNGHRLPAEPQWIAFDSLGPIKPKPKPKPSFPVKTDHWSEKQP